MEVVLLLDTWIYMLAALINVIIISGTIYYVKVYCKPTVSKAEDELNVLRDVLMKLSQSSASAGSDKNIEAPRTEEPSTAPREEQPSIRAELDGMPPDREQAVHTPSVPEVKSRLPPRRLDSEMWSLDGNVSDDEVSPVGPRTSTHKLTEVKSRHTPWRPSTETRTFNTTSGTLKGNGFKEKKSPLFRRGTGLQFKQFLKKFEMVAHYNGWPMEEWVVHLSLCLEEDALEVAMSLEEDATYGELVSALRTRFDPMGRILQHRSELRQRKRKSSETPEEYGAVIRRQFNLAYPGIPQEMSEELNVDKFIEGLTDMELKKHVSLQAPKSLDEAIAKVAQYESVAVEVADLRNKKPLPGRISQVTEVPKETTEARTALQNLRMEIMEEVRNEVTKAIRDATNRSQGDQWRQNKAPVRNVPIWNPQVECYRCRKKGHIATQCRERFPGRIAEMSRTAGVPTYPTNNGTYSQTTRPLN